MARSIIKVHFAIPIYFFPGIARYTHDAPSMDSRREFFTDILPCTFLVLKRTYAVMHLRGAPVQLIVFFLHRIVLLLITSTFFELAKNVKLYITSF